MTMIVAALSIAGPHDREQISIELMEKRSKEDRTVDPIRPVLSSLGLY